MLFFARRLASRARDAAPATSCREAVSLLREGKNAPSARPTPCSASTENGRQRAAMSAASSPGTKTVRVDVPVTPSILGGPHDARIIPRAGPRPHALRRRRRLPRRLPHAGSAPAGRASPSGSPSRKDVSAAEGPSPAFFPAHEACPTATRSAVIRQRALLRSRARPRCGAGIPEAGRFLPPADGVPLSSVGRGRLPSLLPPAEESGPPGKK